MKKWLKILLFSLGILVFGALIYWQFSKKGIIKNQIEKAVAKGTDSEYYIHYDSSYIDEVNGNAAFYNIILQRDSLQEKLLTNDTSLDATLVNVKVKALLISGLDIPGFLGKTSLQAAKIEIVEPVITLIETGKKTAALTKSDTLALYEKITGKFNKINAKQINIVDGEIAVQKKNARPYLTINKVNAVLQNLKIDRQHDYDNIASYLVKDIVVTVATVTSIDEQRNKKIVGSGIKYSAPGKRIIIENASQTSNTSNKSFFELSNINIIGINTNEFVYNNKIQADSFSTAGGKVNIYSEGKPAKGSSNVPDIDNDFFTRAQIKTINIGPTDVSIFSADTKKQTMLKKVKINISSLGTVASGTNLQKLLANSNFVLESAGTSFTTANNQYQINLGAFKINSNNKTASISSAQVKPLLSWAAYNKTLSVQHDLYNLAFSNINIGGLNTNELIMKNSLLAEELQLQPQLRIFNDRTVPFDKSSKVGKYPQQQLMDLSTPLHLKKVVIKNGTVIYRERGLKSEMTGDVSFTNINATVSNVTNIPAAVKNNSNMDLNATATFLGAGKLKTHWVLPLTKGNGNFNASGEMGPMDATILSKITEPLGMAQIQKGKINGLTFSMTGNDYHTDGEAVLKYEGLKVKILKSDGDSTTQLKQKDLISFAANLFIKNSNPRNGETRVGKIDFDRDISKSFFNLLWKSIFQASQRIAKGKNDK